RPAATTWRRWCARRNAPGPRCCWSACACRRTWGAPTPRASRPTSARWRRTRASLCCRSCSRRSRPMPTPSRPTTCIPPPPRSRSCSTTSGPRWSRCWSLDADWRMKGVSPRRRRMDEHQAAARPEAEAEGRRVRPSRQEPRRRGRRAGAGRLRERAELPGQRPAELDPGAGKGRMSAGPALRHAGISRTILDAIGDTPLLEIDGVFANLEFMNPSGSIKARIAWYMVEKAEQQGLLKPGDTIVEATSGNTGNALSMVAAVKGYRMLVVMPEGLSNERVAISRAYGAEVRFVGHFHVNSALEEAKRLGEQPGHFAPAQFESEYNV